jgi:hypothetical protein
MKAVSDGEEDVVLVRIQNYILLVFCNMEYIVTASACHLCKHGSGNPYAPISEFSTVSDAYIGSEPHVLGELSRAALK